MVYVTHDQTEAMTLADRIAILNAGRVEQVGPPLEMYRRPRNLFVARFLGAPPMNLLPGVLLARSGGCPRVRLDNGLTLDIFPDVKTLPSDAAVTVGIRPEDLEMSRTAEGLASRVTVVERLGNRTVIYGTLQASGSGRDGVMPDVIVDVAGQGTDTRADASMGPNPGDIIHLTAAPETVHLFDSAGRAVAHGAVLTPGRRRNSELPCT